MKDRVHGNLQDFDIMQRICEDDWLKFFLVENIIMWIVMFWTDTGLLCWYSEQIVYIV